LLLVAGYLMRSNVSATAGVVVGVVCKIGSVLLNLAIWDQHASPIQLAFLSLGLFGGSLFQQAPLRKDRKEAVQKLPLHQQDMTGKDDDAQDSVASVNASLSGGNPPHQRTSSPPK
jgi:GDP-mannose transporter